VTQVAAQAQAAEGGGATVPVVLNFDAVRPGLRIGASAGVEIVVGRREGAYLPRGPYLTTGGERLAYVVSGDEALRQTVVFGLIDGDRVEVRDGLTAGQRVVTSSYEAFKDREAVRLAPEGEIE
jgi:HlyD family secretion protein